MINNDFIQILKEPKDYYKIRMALTNSMHLFFLYDEKNDVELWSNFLENLIEKFKKFLRISTVSSNKENEKLFNLFIKSKDDILNFPAISFCHPFLTDPIYLNNFSPIDLYNLIEKYYNFYENDFEKEKEKMFEKIKKILDNFPIVCFIKGTPKEPYCKFSKEFIEILNEKKIKYKAFNIFEDEKIRCYLRLYANWKTFPQLYINGKIIGGVDKLKELVEKDELMKLIPENMIINDLEFELREKIERNKEKKLILVINKENEEIINKFNEHKLNFDYVLINESNKKIFENIFNVNEYPILFIKGKKCLEGNEINEIFL